MLSVLCVLGGQIFPRRYQLMFSAILAKRPWRTSRGESYDVGTPPGRSVDWPATAVGVNVVLSTLK